jgi:hypothetical protein
MARKKQAGRQGRSFVSTAIPGFRPDGRKCRAFLEENLDAARLATLLRQRSRPEEDGLTYCGDSAGGQDLKLAGSKLRPVNFTHPEMPDCAVERGLFVGRKNGANLPRRQRS